MKLARLWRHDASKPEDGVVSQVRKTFQAIDVGDGSDGRWAAHLRTLFPQAEGWLTDDGRTAEGALRARKLFEEHMPELVSLLDRLAEQVDRPAAETFLTMAALRPFFSGCTQTGSSGRLLRNYDFPADECEATIVRSHFLRPIIGMQEVGWGLLDGMNDAGLAVSLTFGGRPLAGPGFAVNVVLRSMSPGSTTASEPSTRPTTSRNSGESPTTGPVRPGSSPSTATQRDHDPSPSSTAGKHCPANDLPSGKQAKPPGQKSLGRNMISKWPGYRSENSR
jgi:hypothetical protein